MTKAKMQNMVACIKGVVTLEENGEYKYDCDLQGDGIVILSVIADLIMSFGEANKLSYEIVLKNLGTIIKASESLNTTKQTEEMHEANCWECKWGVKGKPRKDGVIPITCSNDHAVTFDITESVTLCSDFEYEHSKGRRRRK